MRGLIVPIVVLTLLLGACGGSTEEAADSPAPTSAAPSPAEDAATTAAPSDDASSDDGASPENCPELLAAASSAVAAVQLTGGVGPEASAEFTAEYLRELAERAPAEIRDDLEILAEALAGFYETIDASGIDLSDPSSFSNLDASEIQKLEAAVEAMDTPEVDQANQNIQAFFERECS